MPKPHPKIKATSYEKKGKKVELLFCEAILE